MPPGGKTRSVIILHGMTWRGWGELLFLFYPPHPTDRSSGAEHRLNTDSGLSVDPAAFKHSVFTVNPPGFTALIWLGGWIRLFILIPGVVSLFVFIGYGRINESLFKPHRTCEGGALISVSMVVRLESSCDSRSFDGTILTTYFESLYSNETGLADRDSGDNSLDSIGKISLVWLVL
jgi:hypothetical protein